MPETALLCAMFADERADSTGQRAIASGKRTSADGIVLRAYVRAHRLRCGAQKVLLVITMR